jgi:hypothetical protein
MVVVGGDVAGEGRRRVVTWQEEAGTAAVVVGDVIRWRH